MIMVFYNANKKYEKALDFWKKLQLTLDVKINLYSLKCDQTYINLSYKLLKK